MKIWLSSIGILFFYIQLNAQYANLQPVKGLPSDEVYDLLADTKGFIWAAHSLGISRYDGINFKDFNHPLATGAGITDIAEDKQGRIWCHNFNGQVYYIENEQMYLLKAYKYKEEAFYPRLMILNNELLVTSQKGLFVLNTQTFESKYILSKTNSNKAGSIAIVNGRAYITNGDSFMRYESGTKILIVLVFKDTRSIGNIFHLSSLQLQPLSTNDIIYAKYEHDYLSKLRINNGTVQLISNIYEKKIINTVIKNGNSIWINTKKDSYLYPQVPHYRNINLSDITSDKIGNKWFSSLDKGLIVDFINIFWRKSTSINNIKSGYKYDKNTIYGCQNGSLQVIRKNAISKFQLPNSYGAIEKIIPLNDNYFFIIPSVGLYLLNIEKNTVKKINKNKVSVKKTILENNKLIIAFTNATTIVDLANGIKSMYDLDELMKKQTNLRQKRSYDVTIQPYNKKILVAFSDGLHELKSDSVFTPVLYNNEIISASSLLSINDKTFATTFNNGIFIIDKNGIRKKTIKDGLLSNKVLKLKYLNNQLFILEQKNIQVFDISSEKIIKTIALPTEESSVIYDLWQEDSILYLSSNKGLYKLEISSINNTIIPNSYILSVTSDTSVFSTKQAIQLPYSQNNIQFKVISPSFIYPEFTYFRYRILGGNDTSWQQTTTNESNIAFAALKPGFYTFETYAINFQNSRGKTLSYQFAILKPWWQQW